MRALLLPLTAVIAAPLVAFWLVWRRPDIGAAWVFLLFSNLQAVAVVHEVYRTPEFVPTGLFKQYLTLYTNGANDVVSRTAPAPQGPWSPEQLLVPSMQFPGGIYAPFLHPWSTGRELYFNLSEWSAYNVMLMKTVLP